MAALNKIYLELQNWDVQESPDRVRTWGRQHVMLFRVLSQQSEDELLWNLFPKHHLFLHTTDVLKTNPADEWVYSDEAEIFCGVKIAQQTNVNSICTVVMIRYGLTFRVDGS